MVAFTVNLIVFYTWCALPATNCLTYHMLPQIRTPSLITWSLILASHPRGLVLPSTKMLLGVPIYIIVHAASFTKLPPLTGCIVLRCRAALHR